MDARLMEELIAINKPGRIETAAGCVLNCRIATLSRPSVEKQPSIINYIEVGRSASRSFRC
jgi:hypothetical protein